MYNYYTVNRKKNVSPSQPVGKYLWECSGNSNNSKILHEFFRNIYLLIITLQHIIGKSYNMYHTIIYIILQYSNYDHLCEQPARSGRYLPIMKRSLAALVAQSWRRTPVLLVSRSSPPWRAVFWTKCEKWFRIWMWMWPHESDNTNIEKTL